MGAESVLHSTSGIGEGGRAAYRTFWAFIPYWPVWQVNCTAIWAIAPGSCLGMAELQAAGRSKGNGRPSFNPSDHSTSWQHSNTRGNAAHRPAGNATMGFLEAALPAISTTTHHYRTLPSFLACCTVGPQARLFYMSTHAPLVCMCQGPAGATLPCWPCGIPCKNIPWAQLVFGSSSWALSGCFVLKVGLNTLGSKHGRGSSESPTKGPTPFRRANAFTRPDLQWGD